MKLVNKTFETNVGRKKLTLTKHVGSGSLSVGVVVGEGWLSITSSNNLKCKHGARCIS